MKWADFCVSKLTLNDKGFIESIIYYEDFGENLSSNSYDQNRNWMVEKIRSGKTFCSIELDKDGKWNKIGNFSFNNNLFRWYEIPENITKRKSFISYYHLEDQLFKERFKNIFADLIIHKSVEDGEIDSDNSDGYIKQLIQNDYLADTTVLIVLIGENTKHRKHVDWEISGALNPKIGDKCAGILALKLPSHSNYNTGKHTYSKLPARLADNLKSGYAIIRDWTDDRIKIQKYIELAFEKRNTNYDDRDNSRLQMTKNTNENN
ncbi:TIR domain-containing protein [Flavobacterium soyae]|uniref:TIR domain-containing protein n=1 Tax=Flavobacterium soyae TaxID=2903098 RepID=UPI001E589A34|nr:TIR domain-containing protein [Flavobacterium soyae]MCD9576332.1 TIR domain-containing protein [Flavobacterium soyae]